MTGCGSNESAEYIADQMVASGEFLFEGPNTLQGTFLLNSENISEKLSLEGLAVVSVCVNIFSYTLIVQCAIFRCYNYGKSRNQSIYYDKKLNSFYYFSYF